MEVSNESANLAPKDEIREFGTLVQDSYSVLFKKPKSWERPVIAPARLVESGLADPVPFDQYSSGQSTEELAQILGMRGTVTNTNGAPLTGATSRFIWQQW